jgi:hypothetical protein
VELAIGIVVTAVMAVSVVAVLGVSIWAARKDGQHDRDMQARHGSRRPADED